MMRNRVYNTKDEVLQAVPEGAPWSRRTLTKAIHQQPSPGTKMTFSVREAAELIGISRPTMSRLIRENHLPRIRAGRKIAIARQTFLDRLLRRDTNDVKLDICSMMSWNLTRTCVIRTE